MLKFLEISGRLPPTYLKPDAPMVDGFTVLLLLMAEILHHLGCMKP